MVLLPKGVLECLYFPRLLTFDFVDCSTADSSSLMGAFRASVGLQLRDPRSNQEQD